MNGMAIVIKPTKGDKEKYAKVSEEILNIFKKYKLKTEEVAYIVHVMENVIKEGGLRIVTDTEMEDGTKIN
jgi:hypothetical protein